MNQTCEAVAGPGSRFKVKHSLDSDEEDEGEETKSSSSKYDILASDDVEGMSSLTFELMDNRGGFAHLNMTYITSNIHVLNIKNMYIQS